MLVSERINKFNEENAPFIIMDTENDGRKYTLSLMIDFLDGDYKDYGQYAFNTYAESVNEKIDNHGHGYDWERVFKRAFRNEPRMREVDFDCEAGAFFCYATDLSLLEKLGGIFRKVCEDRELFQTLVNKTMIEAEHSTVEEELVREWDAIFTVETPDGIVQITKEDRKDLLKKVKTTVKAVNGNSVIEVDAYDFLNQRIEGLDYSESPLHLYLKTLYPDKEEIINFNDVEA